MKEKAFSLMLPIRKRIPTKIKLPFSVPFSPFIFCPIGSWVTAVAVRKLCVSGLWSPGNYISVLWYSLTDSDVTSQWES
jgi:hypothetical protein